MEVSNNKGLFGIKFSSVTSRGSVKKYPNLAPLSKDTVSFSGKANSVDKPGQESKQVANDIIRRIQTMTDEEFETLKVQIKEKIDSLPDDIQDVLKHIELTKENIFLAEKIISDERLYDADNVYANNNIINNAGAILYFTYTPEQAQAKSDMIDKILSDERLADNIKNAGRIILKINTGEEFRSKSEIIDKILSDERLYNNSNIKGNTSLIVKKTDTPEQVQIKSGIIDKILSDEKLYGNETFMNYVGCIIANTGTPEQAQILNKILSDERLYGNDDFMSDAANIIDYTKTQEQVDAKSEIIDKILSEERLYNNDNFMRKAAYIIKRTNTPEQAQAKSDIIDKIFSDEKLLNNEIFMKKTGTIIGCTDTSEQVQAKSDIINKVFLDERLSSNEILMNKAEYIIHHTETMQQAQIVNKILSDERLFGNDTIISNTGDIIACTKTPEQAQIANEILSDERLFGNENVMKNFIYLIGDSYTPEKVQITNKFLSDERLFGNEAIMSRVGNIIKSVNTLEEAQAKSDIIDKIFSDEKLYGNDNFMNSVVSLIERTSTEEDFLAKSDVIDKILSEERLYGNEILMYNLADIIFNTKEAEQAANTIKLLDDEELSPIQTVNILTNPNEISYKDIKKLNKVIGIHNAEKLNFGDTKTAAKFVDLYKKNNINELSASEKKNVLRRLVKANADLFGTSDNLRKMFPILPKNQEEYCALLPSLVRSLGIETNTLTSERVEQFDSDLSSLSETLKTISDEDFANLEISQEYPTEQFIKDTLSIVKDLPSGERQKVYDYFGFELHHNKNGTVNPEVSKSGFSISGYPVNLNNGKKLAQITNENTKKVVEQLRPIVVKFSQGNPIKCNKQDVEKLLNEVVDVLPELRPQIGKTQHETHDFDVLTHSLKVMQKISQDEKFESLDASDKKLMFLASLLHDITKREGSVDKTHAAESSFDTYFIAKKFNLSQEEQTKLYTLTRHHEWLEYVNTAKDEKALEKRLKSVAYDFRNDNLFDMALMFTHADLKAVKTDDSFHDITRKTGKSFGESADIYAGKIKNLISELKKSQPLLPVTKIPSASTIEKAITTVNEDGSTNIKGVYKDKDGLVIIKYNEVENEDWEKIGFPKGSTSKGIQAGGKHRDKFWNTGDEDVDTGTIKFFAHGLEYANQLIKFDVFPMPDSDALLSVSYAERPESKYRFFRPQGILLDVDAKYVHGGGETDAGSGCGKDIQNFKDNYLFGGKREKDRLYVSNLIKKALEIDDEEYVKFVKENENKPLSEIEPQETREKLVKAYASINSKTRGYGRAYNEMYISNPKPPMAVFAYSMDEKNPYGNPVEFLNEGFQSRTKFLREYALERDVPFFVFGD